MEAIADAKEELKKSRHRPLEELLPLPDGAMVDPDECAALLYTTKTQLAIWRCTRRYDLTWTRIGTQVRYRMGDIRAFVEAHTEQNPGGGTDKYPPPKRERPDVPLPKAEQRRITKMARAARRKADGK